MNVEKWTDINAYRPWSPVLGLQGYIDGFDPNKEYEFHREEWPEPSRFRLSDQPEWFNIAGLRFREIDAP
jgi:hypothetical protein